MTPNEAYILELLQEAYLITKDQTFEGQERATQDDSTVVNALIALGYVTQEDVTRTLAAASNMEYVELSNILVKPEIIDLIPPRQGLPLQICSHHDERRRARHRDQRPAGL